MSPLADAAERLWRPSRVAALACGAELGGWQALDRTCLALEPVAAAARACRRLGIATLHFDALREPAPSLEFDLALLLGWPRPLPAGGAKRLAACVAGLSRRAIVAPGPWLEPLADLGHPLSEDATAAMRGLLSDDRLVVCEAL